MTTIKDVAKVYEAPTIKNIAELEKVPLGLPLKVEEGTDKDGNPFNQNIVEIEGEKYRVPNSVLSQLKTQLEVNDKWNHFKVKKEGEGMKTRYTVIMVD